MPNWLYITMSVLGGIGIALCVVGVGLWFRYKNTRKRLQQTFAVIVFLIGVALAVLLLWDLRQGTA